MEFVEVLKERLNPVAVYLMKRGPFGEGTLLVVMEEEKPEAVEELLEELEIDYDLAVVTKEEFEKIKDSVEKSGERLW